MKKPASKVAEPAQIQPKSQFLFHKNLPPRDFSLMTLATTQVLIQTVKEIERNFINQLYIELGHKQMSIDNQILMIPLIFTLPLDF